MGGNKIEPSGGAANQNYSSEADGSILRGRSDGNAALIFFRRVGRAFADLGGAISRAFSHLADRVRGAFDHVNNAIRGVDRDAALSHVNQGSNTRPVRPYLDIDLDEEESSDFDIANLDTRNLSEQYSANDDNKKETDFSGVISPEGSLKLTEQPPSFEVIKNEPEHDLAPINDDDSKVAIETSVDEKAAQKKTNGEILFYGFHGWYIEKKSVEFLSLGSEYMQSDCLEFAQKIVNNSMAIEFGSKTEFTKDILNSANVLLKLKRQLDAAEEKTIKEEKALEEKKIIEQKKYSMHQGEWDFNEFLNDFISHQERREKFPLYLNGKYRTNPDLLEFAEKVESDINETDYRKQVATYLIRWNKYPEHAEKFTNEAVGFSLVPPPPPPPAPPPRKLQSPKAEPVPVPPEQSAIIKLLNADSRYQEQLRGLINLSRPVMQSGLATLARIWRPDASSSSKDLSPVQPQMRTATADDESYTDLEEIDNAIKLITALADMKTGHNFELSADIEKIKERSKEIIQNLNQQRSQIIKERNIVDITELTDEQRDRGSKIFEQFLSSYGPARQRDELDKLRILDIYFSDEIMSVAHHTQELLLRLPDRTDADAIRVEAAGYLLSKYNQFKLLANAGGEATA